MTAFEEMGIMKELGQAVDEMGWLLPTDIQNEAIPLILGGGDVLLAAETGSGKTGAFCLPVVQIVWETLTEIQSGKLKSKGSGTGSTKWALNMYDRGDQLAIQPDGLLCQARDPTKWHGGRCTKGVMNSGKYTFEATVTDDGLARVGYSTTKATLDLGTDYFSFGYGGTGKKSNSKRFDDYGESFTKGDTISCLIDLDENTIGFAKNGKKFPNAFSIPADLKREVFYPAVVLKNAEMRFNFGAEPLKYPINGYTPICEAPVECVRNSTIGSGGGATAPLKPAPNAPMCIIIEPSRELTQQTYAEIEKFKKYLPKPEINNMVLVGGDSSAKQRNEIYKGVDIVTGTPGKLQEFIMSGELCLSQVRFFVLDEADALLKQDHGPLIRTMHQQIPKMTPDGRRLQMVICSATLHDFAVKKLADELMHFPQWVDLKGQDTVPDTVHHTVVRVDPKADRRWVRLLQGKHIETDGVHAADRLRPGSDEPNTLSEAVKILKGEYVLAAIKQHQMHREQAIIFCRTKLDCDNMEKFLRSNNQEYTCICLHGGRADERAHNLQLFKQGKVRFIICTDVAARGLDIKGIPYVINVTMPDDKSNYLHRIGRVGRAERMGLAISLVATCKEKVWYHSCPSKGKNCNDTRVTTPGTRGKGCCIWYDENQLLADVEEHIGETITTIDTDMNVPINEFDGKVTYGKKRAANSIGLYEDHAALLSHDVLELHQMERETMTRYLNLRRQFAA